ncbi:amidohydrolase family protein [Frankia sp. CNm7]|uniref:Amidohydrolase family protein n=1 Tax=Frankia nepalensis TaxID=1836974 RepID=A0A937RGX7_9ACTN|nr:amidohydrolase family protein [Frankia nepalensis]MBL7496900.1 amidohydrolase family protein [Frankia nepalensis]MBL7508339.1 amidohydrolase family protein [Frankia nepalensis]MBL7524557.1 amidohydrolase family protein [Frankia nepalensis]MBL7626168.1 amidohydrolase family protein [Frankia nepalensis]
MSEELLVSADGHIVEPSDLFLTRLPKHLRDRAVWEEDLKIAPLGEDGRTNFRKLHTPGFEGWTNSAYPHFDGSPNTGRPERILEDMDSEGVRAQVMHPNLSFFGLYSDDHELSMAHARVYNDYVAETFRPHRARIAPTAPIPMTDVDDAVAEIERAAALGLRAILLPAVSPIPYHSRELDRVWATAQANGMVVVFHVATGGVKVSRAASPTLRGLMLTVQAQSQPLTDNLVVDRIVFATTQQSLAPQQIIASLVGGGVTERFGDLHFVLVEFNANWLVSFMAAMDKAWTLGVGQDRDFWVGLWDDNRPEDDQPGMAQVFKLNERWPYPLRPSEYVQRQIHVSFQEDPIALACRHITGLSTLVWGVDYPHPEGTFRRTREAIEQQFRGVSPEDRAAILGGTTAKLFGLEAPVAV